jgi:hypothetical protein
MTCPQGFQSHVICTCIPPQAIEDLIAKCIQEGVIRMEWPGMAGTIEADHKDTTEPTATHE